MRNEVKEVDEKGVCEVEVEVKVEVSRSRDKRGLKGKGHQRSPSTCSLPERHRERSG
jgi:hypothetical protein